MTLHGRRRGIFIPRVEIVEYHNATILQVSHEGDHTDNTQQRTSFECLMDSSELLSEHLLEGSFNDPYAMLVHENFLKRVFYSA